MSDTTELDRCRADLYRAKTRLANAQHRIADLEAKLSAAEAEADHWEAEAQRYAINVDYWRERCEVAEADAERWMDVSVDGYPDKACEVLIARGKATVLGAWIGDSFWYSNEKVAALFWRHLPKPPHPRGDAAIDAARGAK